MDGYGNDIPSWVIDRPATHNHLFIKLLLAEHLRFEHGMALHKIAKRVGVPYREIRDHLTREGVQE